MKCTIRAIVDGIMIILEHTFLQYSTYYDPNTAHLYNFREVSHLENSILGQLLDSIDIQNQWPFTTTECEELKIYRK